MTEVVASPIEISTDDPDEFISLAEWLKSDTLLSKIPTTTRAATASEQMGGAEILTIILDSGGIIAMIGAIGTWIKYRQPSVKVKLRAKNGRTVEVEAKNAGDVEEIAAALKLDRE